jgi:hypothetical protein
MSDAYSEDTVELVAAAIASARHDDVFTEVEWNGSHWDGLRDSYRADARAALDVLAECGLLQHPAMDGACHSVWLHGKWRWLTRKMTTAEKEAFADAVERFSASLDDEGSTSVDRTDAVRRGPNPAHRRTGLGRHHRRRSGKLPPGRPRPARRVGRARPPTPRGSRRRVGPPAPGHRRVSGAVQRP